MNPSLPIEDYTPSNMENVSSRVNLNTGSLKGREYNICTNMSENDSYYGQHNYNNCCSDGTGNKAKFIGSKSFPCNYQVQGHLDQCKLNQENNPYKHLNTYDSYMSEPYSSQDHPTLSENTSL